MRTVLVSLVAVLAGVTAQVAGASGSPRTPSSSCPVADTVTVDINLSYGFSPASVDIAPGITVCWRNADGWGHDVTSDTGEFSSREIPLTRSYAFTFNRPGAYPYHNANYPSMTGIVNVGPGKARCSQQAVVVHVADEFDPATTNVSPNNPIVCWTNDDDRVHDVASDALAFDSGELAPGDVFGFTFNWAGPYPYHDALYAEMTGTVETFDLPPTPPPPAPPDPRYNCPPGAS